MTLPSLTKEEISAFPPIDCQQGLTAQEVEERVKGHLTNKTKKAVSKSYGKILFDNFCNPFNLLLIVITIVMIWGKLSFTHFLFAFILGINIAIGLYQDIHARHLIEKLKVLSDDRCRVLRDGAEVEVTKDAIVKDDIVLLKQGDQIPADAIVRTGHCSCDESLLTGESVAAKKTPGDPLLSGTYIRSGSCVAQIIHVGADSYAEKLQKNATAFSRPKSEIAQSVWNITVSCALIALVFGIAYTLVCFAQNQVSWDSLFPMTDQGSEFIEGLSGSMVAMLPTGMFLLTSVALTTGVVVLAKKNVLVQELYCIEALARVDVLCFDKTGTLTDGAMSVHEAIPFRGFSASRLGYGVNAILAATGDDNATAKALKARFGGRHKGDVRTVIPFDSENKYSAVSLFDDGTFALGAYGFLPAKKCLEAELLMKSYEAKGYRCLVLAYSENLISNGVLPRNLEICGVFVFQDHIKEDAKDNVAWFQDSGVEVYVISGDSPIAVSEIATQCGVKGAENYVDMSQVKDEDIPALVETNRIFGRVLPEQKKKIVLALQEKGHRVAMTGDGVNDILALKAADCSIAMASGAAAAKNASHLIMTKSDFSSLPDVVAQGRRVINNLQRSCSLFLSKTLWAMVVSAAFLFSMFFGGPKYPFSTANLLVWEVLAIGIPSFFLALQPSSERIDGSLLKNIFVRALPCGAAEVLCVALPQLYLLISPNLISYNPQEVAVDTVAMCIIAFTLFSFVTLYQVSRPLNLYRSIVFFACLGAGIIIFVIDFFVRVPPGRGTILQFMWGGYAWSYPLMLLSTVAIATLADIGLVYLIKKGIRRRRSES